MSIKTVQKYHLFLLYIIISILKHRKTPWQSHAIKEKWKKYVKENFLLLTQLNIWAFIDRKVHELSEVYCRLWAGVISSPGTFTWVIFTTSKVVFQLFFFQFKNEFQLFLRTVRSTSGVFCETGDHAVILKCLCSYISCPPFPPFILTELS